MSASTTYRLELIALKTTIQYRSIQVVNLKFDNGSKSYKGARIRFIILFGFRINKSSVKFVILENNVNGYVTYNYRYKALTRFR